MPLARHYFRSAMDWWVLAILLVPTARLTWALLRAAEAGRWPSAGLVIASLTFAGVWYSVATTGYEIDDTHLIVRFGPFKNKVPLQSVHSLRATTSVLSAPALSFRRIEVGSSYVSVQISPKDRAGFVAAIRARVPSVRVEGI